MIEAVLNQPFTTVVTSAPGASASDAALFLNGSAYTGPAPIVTQISGSSNTWSVTFTPTSTGILSFRCFGEICFRVPVVQKSLYVTAKNLEDEALGSWSWNKTTGVLTLLRQDGSAFTSFNVADTSVSGSRERIN